LRRFFAGEGVAHGGAVVLARPSVLVVDRSADTREVLRTALGGRGALVLEATRADVAVELARKHRPDVIVFDLELAQSASGAIRAALEESRMAVAPVVLLGTARRAQQDFPAGQFVAKPYHYGQLIRKIEELLDAARRRADGPG
jgi:CheY-like chemotaxis protein